LKELAELIKFTRPFLALVSKAKAAKMVRNMIDQYLDLEAGTGEEVAVSFSFVFKIYRQRNRLGLTTDL